MAKKSIKRFLKAGIIALTLSVGLFTNGLMIGATEESEETETETDENEELYLIGGGYAITGQLPDVGYSAIVYDATNGLPTSDANCV